MRSCRSLAAAALVALAAGAAAAPGRITVAREAVVEGPTIRLGEIAALEGAGAEALAAVPIGAAPSAGESRLLDGRTVLHALRREAGGLDGLLYTIPPAVRVRRAAQEISAQAVRAILEDHLASSLGEAAADAELRAVELPGPVRIPAGPYTARVLPPPGAAPVGRVRLQVEFTVDGRPARTVWVTADVGLHGPVVVARRPVARGETLAADDLALDRRDLSQAPRGVLADPAEAVGRVAQAPLVPWAPIRRDQLAAAAVVRRGDVVLLVAERGTVRITAPGEVRADAGLGEQVRVLNRTSRKDVVGRVVDGATVAVDF
jgi:flagella basal body P-ring formation protein FlgA